MTPQDARIILGCAILLACFVVAVPMTILMCSGRRPLDNGESFPVDWRPDPTAPLSVMEQNAMLRDRALGLAQ